jgi:O-antigen/teichoic acid export membrane protein
MNLQEIDLKAKMRDGVFWVAVSKFSGQGVSWVITIFVARILSPDDYGLMGMVGAYIAFIVLFSELGLGAAIIQKREISDDDLNNISWLVFSFNLFLYILSASVAPLLAAFFNEPRLTNLIRVISLILIINSFSLVPSHMLTRKMIFDKRSMAEFAGSIIGAVSTLVFAVRGFGVWSLVFGNLLLELTKNTTYFFYYPWIPRLTFSFPKIKDMIHFGLQVAVARFFWYLFNNADFVIAGRLLGKTMLGYYSLAFQFASMPLEKIVSVITQVAYPAFSEVQNDEVLLKKYFLKLIRLLSFWTFPMFFGILVVSDLAVPLFLTDKWLPIVLPLKMLCLVSAFKAINALYGPLLMAKGRPGIVGLNNAMMAVVLTGSFYVGSHYGLEGLAYSWLAFPVVFLITTYISLSIINLKLIVFLKEMIHPLLGTLMMSFTVILTQNSIMRDSSLVVKMVGSILIGVVTYFSYFCLFNREMYEENKALFKIKRSLFPAVPKTVD